MRSFAMLDSEIIRSSIWAENDCTRLVWITMLAMKDQDGFVRGCVGTIAAAARQKDLDTADSLKLLESPDPDSASTEQEGRRILKIPGGWMIVNHAKYKDRDREEKRREYLKEYMRSYMRDTRAVKQEKYNKKSNDVLTSVSVSVSASEEGGCKGGGKVEVEFDECWSLYPDKTGKSNAKKDYIKARKSGTTQEQVLSGLNRYIAYVRHRQATDFKDLKFANGSTWFHQHRWEDECKIAEAKQLPSQKIKRRIDLDP